MKARTEGGHFTSLYDFCERVDLSAVNRRMIESFIKAGALDSLGAARAQLFAVIDGAMEIGTRAQKDRASGQSGLFADLAAHEPAAARSPAQRFPTGRRKRSSPARKKCSGSTSPAIHWTNSWIRCGELATHFTSGLEGLQKNTEVALCGILTGIQRKRNKEGKLWAALQIEDKEGSLEAMVFSTQYERLLPVLNEDQAVLVRGLVLPEENAPPKISVQDIVLLENARVRLPSLISDPRSGERSRCERPDRCRPCQRSFPIVRPQARQDGSPPASRKAARLLGYPGRTGQSPSGQGILRRAGAHLRTGSAGSTR